MNILGYQPDYAVSPGSVVAEHLEVRGLSQAAFARLCGRSPKMISEIISGKAPVEPTTALQFEKVLGMKAVIWLGIEKDYRLHLAKQDEASQLAELLDWAKEFPLGDLYKNGVVPKGKTDGSTVSHLLQFFGVASPKAWDATYARLKLSFRHSPSFESKAKHVATWIRMGEIQAAATAKGIYNKDLFKENLRQVRSLTRSTPDNSLRQVRSLCAQAGVSVVFVPCLPGVPISGAAYWLDRSRPVIQLSGRHRTDDHFWFTLFHEAAHILFDAKKAYYLDIDVGHDTNDNEARANKWAANFLVNSANWKSFVASYQFTDSTVRSFCDSLDVAPGIVVGRLQHEEYLDWSELNHLKVNIYSVLYSLSREKLETTPY